MTSLIRIHQLIFLYTTSGSIGSDVHKQLKAQHDLMRADLRRSEEFFSEERIAFKAEAAGRLMAQERAAKVRGEMASLRLTWWLASCVSCHNPISAL